MNMELPIYKAVINEDDENSGVEFVALVDKPAIEVNWQHFKDIEQSNFKATDTDQRIVSGALMLADTPIFRRDKVRGEYYVVFDKETIQNIVEKFFKNKNNSNVNIMHDAKSIVDDVFMFESFIINREKNLVPKGFENLTDGTWFGSYKINNKDVWEQMIKTENLKGFSIEVQMQLEKDDDSETLELIEKIKNILHTKK
jgi:hypothetical protein